MVARRNTNPTWGLARRALIAACLALLWAAPRPACAETIQAFSVQVSNAYIGQPGSPLAPTQSAGFFGGSVLEQWVDQSRPYVRITNTSAKPAAMNLVAAQLDMTNSASLITACDWMEGFGLESQTWNWNAELTSAFFQFHEPILPGESILMRLSTAPRPGMEMLYTQNQSLLPPSLEYVACTDHCTEVTVFAQPVESTAAVSYLPSGQPSAPDLLSYTTTIDSMITACGTIDSSAEVSVNVMRAVPVPEPSSVALAASAAVILALAARGRGRGFRSAA